MICCHVHGEQRASEGDSLYDVLPMIGLEAAINQQE